MSAKHSTAIKNNNICTAIIYHYIFSVTVDCQFWYKEQVYKPVPALAGHSQSFALLIRGCNRFGLKLYPRTIAFRVQWIWSTLIWTDSKSTNLINHQLCQVFKYKGKVVDALRSVHGCEFWWWGREGEQQQNEICWNENGATYFDYTCNFFFPLRYLCRIVT